MGRIGAFRLPYPVSFHSTVPDLGWLDAVVLIPFPTGKELIYEIPRTVPTIVCGDASYIAEAFRRGAADYLCAPWTENELVARVGRLIPKTTFTHPVFGVILQGSLLTGPAGSVVLAREESALFRTLVREAGGKVSRVALRRLLWPSTESSSRIVDETVSRLRCHLNTVGISKSHMEIRSIRGFGYVLEIFF